MAQWYYLVNSQQQGPVSSEQLKELSAGGTVTPETYVWREGMDDWKPAKMVQGLFDVAQPGAASGGSASPQAQPFQSTQPNPYAASPGVPAGAGPNTTGVLVCSILATICCCVPLGIPAIVYAAIATSKMGSGDVAGAYDAAGKAKMWAWIAFGLGLLLNILVAAVQILAVAGGMRTM
jgi:hypothetical protein